MNKEELTISVDHISDTSEEGFAYYRPLDTAMRKWTEEAAANRTPSEEPLRQRLTDAEQEGGQTRKLGILGTAAVAVLAFGSDQEAQSNIAHAAEDTGNPHELVQEGSNIMHGDPRFTYGGESVQSQSEKVKNTTIIDSGDNEVHQDDGDAELPPTTTNTAYFPFTLNQITSADVNEPIPVPSDPIDPGTDTPTPPPTETPEPSPTPEKETLTVSAGHPVFEGALDRHASSDSSELLNLSLPKDSAPFVGIYENGKLVPIALQAVTKDGEIIHAPLTSEFMTQYGEQLPDIEDPENVVEYIPETLETVALPSAVISSSENAWYGSINRGVEIRREPFTVSATVDQPTNQTISLAIAANSQNPTLKQVRINLYKDSSKPSDPYGLYIMGSEYNPGQEKVISSIQRTQITTISSQNHSFDVEFSGKDAVISYINPEEEQEQIETELPFAFEGDNIEIAHGIDPTGTTSPLRSAEVTIIQPERPETIYDYIAGVQEAVEDVELRTQDTPERSLCDIVYFILPPKASTSGVDSGNNMDGFADYLGGYGIRINPDYPGGYDVSVAEIKALDRKPVFFLNIEDGINTSYYELGRKLEDISAHSGDAFIENFFAFNPRGNIELHEKLQEEYGSPQNLGAALSSEVSEGGINISIPVDHPAYTNEDAIYRRMSEIISSIRENAGRDDIVARVVFDAEHFSLEQILDISQVLNVDPGIENYGSASSRLSPSDVEELIDSFGPVTPVVFSDLQSLENGSHLVSTTNGTHVSVSEEFVLAHVRNLDNEKQ